VKLQRTGGDGTGDWVTLRSARDYDGWHDTEDLAGTTTVNPCNFPRQSDNVVATFSWKGASSGEKTWHPSHGGGSFSATDPPNASVSH
jgi:hypothetical protein